MCWPLRLDGWPQMIIFYFFSKRVVRSIVYGPKVRKTHIALAHRSAGHPSPPTVRHAPAPYRPRTATPSLTHIA